MWVKYHQTYSDPDRPVPPEGYESDHENGSGIDDNNNGDRFSSRTRFIARKNDPNCPFFGLLFARIGLRRRWYISYVYLLWEMLEVSEDGPGGQSADDRRTDAHLPRVPGILRPKRNQAKVVKGRPGGQGAGERRTDAHLPRGPGILRPKRNHAKVVKSRVAAKPHVRFRPECKRRKVTTPLTLRQ
jgi:hypothetical protein